MRIGQIRDFTFLFLILLDSSLKTDLFLGDLIALSIFSIE